MKPLSLLLTAATLLALLTKPSPDQPASPYHWADLAESYAAAGDLKNAEKSFARARFLAPHIPPIWIRDANFHFETGQTQAALTAAARVLATVPDYDSILFATFDRQIPDPNEVTTALASNPRASIAWFQHLLDTNAIQPSQFAWDQLVSHKYATDKLAATYITDLLRNHKYDEAGDSWTAYLGPRRGDYPDRNLLFNGNFETEPTGSPLDWTPATVRDKSMAKDGAYSARIAANLTPRQTARVQPGPHRLRAWVRTKEIPLNQGIRLRIYDAENPAHFDFRTEPRVSARDWLPIFEFVEIPPATNLVNVEILGEGWVDQVSLTRDIR